MSALEELGRLRTNRGRPPRKRDNKAAFLFLLPWFAGLVLITAGPVAVSLGLSFTDYNLIQDPTFNGLHNYTRMLHDDRLQHALTVTFIYVLVSVPLQLTAAPRETRHRGGSPCRPRCAARSSTSA